MTARVIRNNLTPLMLKLTFKAFSVPMRRRRSCIDGGCKIAYKRKSQSRNSTESRDVALTVTLS